MNNLSVVIIGGWAQSAASYQSLAKALEAELSIDQSGSLTSVGAVQILPLESTASALYDQLDALALRFGKAEAPVLWLGCSLGGLHLLQWLQRRFPVNAADPDRDLKQLNEFVVLFGTNPHFCERLDEFWPGMPVAALDTMQHDLATDQARTIRAFNVLQCRSLPGTRRRAALKALNDSPTRASHQVLAEGLDVLKTEDLRTELVTCSLPLMALFGEFDPITGERVASATQSLIENTSQSPQRPCVVKQIESAGHYPDELTSTLIASYCGDFLGHPHAQESRRRAHG